VTKNPHQRALLTAAKQATLVLADIQKLAGKPLHDSVPLMQLNTAITDFEKWEKETQ
jgi:hypothetical protein